MRVWKQRAPHPAGMGVTRRTAPPPLADATVEATLGDAGPEGGDGAAADASESGALDAAVGAHLLVPGSNLVLDGLTSDDNLIFYDYVSSTYYAQPLGGGERTAISTAPASAYAGYAVVIGNVVFTWAWNSDYVGTATVWTGGMPSGIPLTNDGLAYLYQTLWASDDGQHIAFLASTNADSGQATVGSIYGANVDGSGATLLVSNIDTSSSYQGDYPACFPRLVFRGDYAVVSYCSVADGGLEPLLQAFSISGGWSPAATVPDWIDSRQYYPADWAEFTFPFAVDPDGRMIAAASRSSGNGALQLFPIDGGAGTVVDPTLQEGPNLSFTGSVTNPWLILYNDDAGDLKQASAANPVPQGLVNGGVHYFDGLSADGNWMLVSSQTNVYGWFSDLSLVSTTNPGPAVLVVSSNEFDASAPVAASTSSSNALRGFTTDSSHVLAMTNVQLNLENQWMGMLQAMSVTAPNTTVPVAEGFVLNYLPLKGAKVLVGDNFQEGDGGSAPTIDLDEVDLGSVSGNATVNIAKRVSGAAVASSDLTQVAYSLTAGPAPGIYVSTVP
jgi:hypothetical protein